ncbi:hypothetical protein BHE74_00037434 [Ensete ventricosum]|nr:hypothetical protein GW17_00005849 [Ensete ventricosum]RWW55885.1 hypothetical protein BHE74_00037434 [Ensete ventricosum]RZS11495.1 hypothetical protein BHM03_00042823 [Ensete ventricosum]
MNPFGHHGSHHHHHHGQEEEDERHRYPPPGYQPPVSTPPYYGGPAYPPAVQHVSHEGGPGYGLPAVQHVSHEGGPGCGPPPPVYPPPPGYHGEGSYGGSHHHHGPSPPPTYPPPPVYHGEGSYGGSRHHQAPSPPPTYPPAPGPEYPRDGGYGHQDHHHHHFLSHFPGVHHVSHERWEGEAAAGHGQPTVRIYTKAENNFSLSIRDGKVILARNDPTDPDMRYSTKVKDEEGFPSFALINKVTGEALKHSIDESVLWSESKDLGDGFRCIRMVNNIRLNFDAFHGDKNHGGVRDGTILVLWEWLKGDNQRWKIVPHCKFLKILLTPFDKL